MILHIISDASNLSEAEARSRTGGYFYLRQQDEKTQLINVPLLCLSTIMKHVVSSESEAEVGSIFINAKEAAPLHVMLEEMGHPQPATPIQMDNFEQQIQSETVQRNGHEILLDKR
jgi:hypothetical protein